MKLDRDPEKLDPIINPPIINDIQSNRWDVVTCLNGGNTYLISLALFLTKTNLKEKAHLKFAAWRMCIWNTWIVEFTSNSEEVGPVL